MLHRLRSGMMTYGAGLVPQFQGKWYPALRASGSQRAGISFIGDSLIEGIGSTDHDTKSFMAIIRANLQRVYGNGGEGFMAPVHTSDPLESGWASSPTNRWSFTSGAWTFADAATREGWGAIGGGAYWNGVTVEPALTFSGDSIQVMTGIKFVNTDAYLLIYVDGTLKLSVNVYGGLADHSQFAPGTVYTLSGLSNGSHTIKFDTATSYVWIEGVRPLFGSCGVVCDRYAKSGLRAEWLGLANDSDYTNYNQFYKTLYSTIEAIPAHLYVIMLGTNDYGAQTALDTFESRLTVIVQRCKAQGDVAIISPPQPNTSLTIPFSSYVGKMADVAAAQGAAYFDVYTRWGAAYRAAYMNDTYHPNDAGHADIAEFITPGLMV